MPARPLATTRRTALVVTAGLTGFAACTSDSPDDPAAPTDPATTSAPPVDADQVLVDAVIERLNTALGMVVTAGGASRPLARELAGLGLMHVAHLEALGGSEDSTTYDGTPGRREVVAAETRLQRYLITSAVQAESGTLAKLLASMAAAVAQHLVVLG